MSASSTITASTPSTAVLASRPMPSELIPSSAFRVTLPPATCSRRRKLRFFVARSTDDDDGSPSAATSSAATATETARATAVEEDGVKPEESEIPPVELPKGPPSLISAVNVEKALRGIAITEVDHYSVLGLPRGCSYDQIPVAYKKQLEEVNILGLEEDELNKKLELLKESYTILSTPEDRRLYDWSLARNDQPDRYMWPFEVDVNRNSFGDPPPQEPEDVGPTRLVGYFLLSWLILGFILSVVLNR